MILECGHDVVSVSSFTTKNSNLMIDESSNSINEKERENKSTKKESTKRIQKRNETKMFMDILEILTEQGNLPRSSLLNKANLNYIKGKKILLLMNELGWIELD
jgi:predicted transcriptional regulator